MLLIKLVNLYLSLLLIFCEASSGELEKKIDEGRLSDRIYQSDYFYFISGDPNTKVNFSIGYELFKKFDIDLEYNQTMFWELQKKSKPFNDINFNPKIIKRKKISKNLIVDIGLYEHHSNGVDGQKSRSYDSTYVFPKYIIRNNKFTLYIGSKLRGFYRLSDFNRDIDNFLGYIEVSSSFSYILNQNTDHSFKINYSTSPGGTYDDLYQYGYHKLDIIYDTGKNGLPFNIHGQIYSGFGESLLNYNREQKSYRIGVSI